MAKPFEERNQTDSARRKLKTLAKATGLSVDLVTALANFTWDYDPEFGKEPVGWVDNDNLPVTGHDQLCWIAEAIGVPPDFELTHEQATAEVIQAHGDCSSDSVWSNFYAAATSKNYGRVSEFATYHYLRGLNTRNAVTLSWKDSIGLIQVARKLFLKLFRGGAMERHDLSYLWCDLKIDLGFQELSPTPTWLSQLLGAIEDLTANSGLKDLLGCCKGLVSGDKFFKQEVLQSLAYADVLRVGDLPVTSMFIANRRDELSPHFYANEWTFPLRFWSSNGGMVNREAIPAQKTA